MRDDALVDALAADPDGAPLGARSRAFVTYALKLTRTRHAVVAYFNFVNRVAAGLGVELEETR